jgi:hypothetical protein
MTKRWEKLGIEDRKKVIDAVFGSWGRYMAGAEEVSIGGINVTREQLDSLRDLMSRHDKYRQHGGEIEALTQAAKDMDEFRREIARIVDAPVWDDISWRSLAWQVRCLRDQRAEACDALDAIAKSMRLKDCSGWAPETVVSAVKRRLKRKGARKKKPGESAKRGVRR